MANYKIIQTYERWDDTIGRNNSEKVEYPLCYLPFEYFKDARAHLGYIAEKNGFTPYPQNIGAEKITICIDEETEIKTYEVEYLKIVRV